MAPPHSRLWRGSDWWLKTGTNFPTAPQIQYANPVDQNPPTTDLKRKIRAFKKSYTYNRQDDGNEILFVTIKMVRPNPR